MSLDIDRSKNSFKLWFLLGAVVSSLCVFFLWAEDLISVSYVKDFPSSSIHLCCVILNIIALTTTFRLLFLFLMEYKLTNRNENTLLQCWEHVKIDKFSLLIVVIVANAINIVFIVKKLQPNWSMDNILCSMFQYILNILCFSAFFACVDMYFDNDDGDLALSQSMETSIGALWACGAYTAFYEKVLFDVTNRMTHFENQNGLRFLVKKLVIICPLSCNATGSLADQHAEITDVGDLEPIEEDQGANLNRCLKSTVYRIGGQSGACIAAELPSPLATLWETRANMNKTIWKYHRDCFIRVLRNHVRSYPCIVLEYDDQNPDETEPLHSFLLSRLKNHSLY